MARSINGTPDHDTLPGVSSADHHTATVSGDIALNELDEKDHTSLDTVGTDDHHAQAHSVESHSNSIASLVMAYEE